MSNFAPKQMDGRVSHTEPAANGAWKMRRSVAGTISRYFHTNKVLQSKRIEPFSQYIKYENGHDPQHMDATKILMHGGISSGKRHALLMAQASRSVIVQRKGSRSDKLDEETKSIVKNLGKLKYFSHIKSTPERSRYLVEYENKTSVLKLLYQGKDGAVENHMVEIGTDQKLNETPQQMAPKIFPKKQRIRTKELLQKQASMEDQIKIIVKQNLMSSNEIRSRYLFLFVLENVLRNHLKSPFKMKPFGSSITGAGMPGSDMDIVILTKNYIENTQKKLPKTYGLLDTEVEMRAKFYAEREEILLDLETLVTDRLRAKNVELILTARVPILKFQYPHLDLSIDLTANLFHGDNFANVINWYIRFDDRVLPVLIIIRKWAEARSLLSHGVNYLGFTPFMLQMLVLIYLMREAVIPPMKKFSAIHRDELIIKSTPQSFTPKSQNTDSAAKLICSFFDYYAAHGLTGRRLCLLHGNFRHRRRTKMKLWIRNPFDDTMNITGNCSVEKAEEMVKKMRETSKLLIYRKEKLENRDWGLSSLLFGKE